MFVVCATIFLCLLFDPLSAQQQQAPVPKAAAAAKKVGADFVLENVRLAVFDREATQPSGADSHSLEAGQKLGSRLAVDSQKKVQLTFLVKDKSTAATLTPHQAFVLLVHQPSQREIIYVAEPDKQSKLYTFSLDMKSYAKDFAGIGGTYAARLLLGDSQLATPLSWHFADFELDVPAAGPEPQLPKSSQVNYEVLPEIKHVFREGDPRPPAFVSDLFAAICAVPLLMLLILWLYIGLNFSNIQLSVWALGFHVGLCAIFGLYAGYWLQLNIFQTLKWLAIIGAPTLFCGNRLLRGISNSPKKQKPE